MIESVFKCVKVYVSLEQNLMEIQFEQFFNFFRICLTFLKEEQKLKNPIVKKLFKKMELDFFQSKFLKISLLLGFADSRKNWLAFQVNPLTNKHLSCFADSVLFKLKF